MRTATPGYLAHFLAVRFLQVASLWAVNPAGPALTIAVVVDRVAKSDSFSLGIEYINVADLIAGLPLFPVHERRLFVMAAATRRIALNVVDEQILQRKGGLTQATAPLD